MLIDPTKMIGISQANQNFSRIAKLVDEKEEIVLMKHNSPKYVVMQYEKYQEYKKNKDGRQ